jgi:hypothetical protein
MTSKGQNVRGWTLDVANQLSLGARITVDIPLGRFDGSMPREKLHVAQAAPGAVDIAGGHRDEAAPSGM